MHAPLHQVDYIEHNAQSIAYGSYQNHRVRAVTGET